MVKILLSMETYVYNHDPSYTFLIAMKSVILVRK